MNEMVLLLGLLVFSYIGSVALAPGAGAGFGAPSGSHWVVFGFILGPHVFAFAPSDATSSFGPLALVATAWVALVCGSGYGFAGNRSIGLRAFVLGLTTALITAASVGAATYCAARWLAHMEDGAARTLAAGVGLAGCETSRHALRWVVERGATPGRLLTLLEEISETDDLVPMLGIAFLFAGMPSSQAVLPITPAGWLAVTLLLGLVIGLTATMLLASLKDAADAWTVLLGAALLGIGIAWRLQLSPLTVLFVMGICISLSSRHAAELRPLLARTEPAVLLPTLILSGALLRFDAGPMLWWTLSAAIVTRVLVRAALGGGLARATHVPAGQRWTLGLGLSCSGTVSVLVGLTFAFRFPGPLGNAVLTISACSSALGDVLGPSGLRHALSPPVAHEPAAVTQ